MTKKHRPKKPVKQRARRQRPAARPAGEVATTERLARALTEAGAPADMIARARAGYYDDFKSELPTPHRQLVDDLNAAELVDLAVRADGGEFDASKAEGDAYFATGEGRQILAEFLSGEYAQPLRSMLAAGGADVLGGGLLGRPASGRRIEEVAAAAMAADAARAAAPPKPAGPTQFGDQDPQRDANLMVALVDLMTRTGGTQFEYGTANEDADTIEAAGWYVSAHFRGTRVSAEHHRSMSNACMELAWKILHGSRCRCRRVVSLDPAGIMAADRVGVDGSKWTAEEQIAAGVCTWELEPVAAWGEGEGAAVAAPRWVGSCGAGKNAR